MHISSIQPHQPVFSTSHLEKPGPQDKSADVKKIDSDDDRSPSVKADNVPGVIRLLEAGHFKGVADVRLRINFHDQLQQRAADKAADTLRTGADELVKTTASKTDEVLTSFATDQASREAVQASLGEFSESVDATLATALKADDLDLDAITSDLRAAFDDLVGGLRDLFGSDEADTFGADALVSVAPTAGIPPAIDAFEAALTELTEAFDLALSSLMESVESSLYLPDPSPAPGNGSAYDKFLAIYHNLGSSDSQLDAVA